MSEAHDDRPRRPCPACGEAILVQARKCPFCRQTFDAALRAEEDAARPPALAGMITIPPGVPQSAILASWLGAATPFMCWTAPFAFGVGCYALGHVRRDPRLRGRARAWVGIVAGGLGMAVIAVLAYIAATGPARGFDD